MHQVQLTIACEGPLVLNDHLFELCRDVLAPQGDFFFQQVSRYGDYLVDIAQKPGFRAGDTLKLILPFLKSAGLTNARLAEYAGRQVALVPRAEGAYRFLHTLNFPLFLISAGCRPFAEAVGARLGFAPERLYSTDVDLDRYALSAAEAADLRRLLGEIVAAPPLELPPKAQSPEELSQEVQASLHLLDRIFWETLPGLDIGRMHQDLTTMGGPEKAQALADSLDRTGLSWTDLMYVGDSRTDVPALEQVRASGGLALSFNGDRAAVRAAEIIVVADNAWPVALLAAVFREWGKEGVVELAQSTQPGGSRYLVLPEAVIAPLAMGLEGGLFNLYHPNTSRREEVIADSGAMRRRLRGEAANPLGGGR